MEAINDDDRARLHDMDTARETHCGIQKWRPRCLQKANNPKALLATMCYFAFLLGFFISGISNVNTSTLERRFDLSSKGVAWITTSYDISAALFCLLMGYLGTFAHKGRLLAITAGMLSLGGFVMVIPHLTAGTYELDEKVAHACFPDEGGFCSSRPPAAHLSRYLGVFITGMILVSPAGASVFLIGTTWLDDNISPEDTPVYIGVLQCMTALGPAVAYVVGGFFLDIYVDVTIKEEELLNITPKDPQWVGAWWIGYLLVSLATLPLIILMLCFPEKMPAATVEKPVAKESQAYRGQGDDETCRPGFGRSWSDVVFSLRLLFSNPPWVLLTAAGVVENGTITAIAVFLPKIIQFQFNLTAGNAAMYAGVVVVPGAAIGHLIGGLIPKWAKLKVKGMFVMCGICSVVAMLLSPIILLRCNMARIAGITVQYSDSVYPVDTVSLTDTCNSKCGCTALSYEPVCTTTGIEYFSPCHAGCSEIEHSEELDSKIYYDCSCITDHDNTTTASQWEVRDGICNTTCNKLPIFLVVFLLLVFATFIPNTAAQAIVMRCVPAKNRAFSYGIQSFLIRLIGSVGPLITGGIFDSSCEVWQDKCGSRGSCWIYDNASLSFKLFLMAFITNIISMILFFLAAYLYEGPKQKDDNSAVPNFGSTQDSMDMQPVSPVGVGAANDSFTADM